MLSVKLGNCIKEVVEKTTENNQYEVLSVTKDGIFSQEEFFKKQIASKNNIGYKVIRKNNLVFSTMNLWMGSLDVLTNYEIGIVSPAYKIFEFNKELMLPEFANYFMKSHYMIEKYKDCSEQGASIVRRNLNLKQLLNIKINIPEVQEQKQIADALEKVDNIIKDYEKLIIDKDQMIKSQFVEMFGNKECPKCKLNDITEKITKGTTPTTVGFSYENYGINFIKIESINDDGSLNFKMLSHINKSCYEKLSRSQLQEGDILFSIAGAIGKIAIVNKEILPANTNQALAIIRIKNNIINKLFLKYMLNSNFITQQYMSKKRGVAQLNLSLEDISNLEILNPAVEEQEKFASFVELIDKQKFELEKQKKNYELLKKGIMQKLIDEQQ